MVNHTVLSNDFSGIVHSFTSGLQFSDPRRIPKGVSLFTAYICKRLTGSVEESTIWTAAVTSLKMEAEGPIKRELREVEEHVRKNY